MRTMQSEEARCWVFCRVTRLLHAILLVASITASVAHAQPPPASKDTRGPIHQLRIYEIFDSNKQAFHERFRDHALRIMARYDFKIVATWETRHDDRAEFVYLLEWPDDETMKDRWAKFMADKESSEIKEQLPRSTAH